MIVSEISPKEALKQFFGFDKFKGDQEKIIESVLAGHNTFVLMPTGGGKSLCYQLPALMSNGTAIVVSPLIALMKNQVDAIRGISAEDGIAHFLNSSLTKNEIARMREDVRRGVTKMLYVAPESLTKQENIDFLREVPVSFFAIDEAHCISEWGHDFRPEYRRLRPIMEEITHAPVIALTATATDKVQQDILKNLGVQSANVFKASFNRSNLYYEVRPKNEPLKEMLRFIKEREGKSGIIYCLSRKKVEEIAESLKVNGVRALPYHAGMDAHTRASHQDDFLMERCDVIVATIAFGMGIDKPDVRFVIHYDIPKSLESYYQETGRAGRDGGEGHCLAFYSYKDIEKLEKFLQGKHISEMEIGRALLGEIVNYAETSVCRRKYILHYFGEHYDVKNCQNGCDNCKYPKELHEAQEEITLLLRTIEAVKEKHKAKHIVAVLRGDQNVEVQTYKHDLLEVYAQGKGNPEAFWGAAIRQAVLKGLVSRDIETYGELKITPEGKRFLANPQSFMMVKETNFSATERDSEPMEKPVSDPILYKMLLDLRQKVARKQGVPPYVIFMESSLHEMAIQYPVNNDELTRIAGVGAGKASRYGKEFIDLIARYVEENEIERPDDFVMRSVVNKSGLKVHIIQNIDRKVPLENIASAKGKSLDEIIEEIESIVFSGTRVNIDYYLKEMLDEDELQDIYDYFMEAENDNIENAYSEFDGDFTEEQLRLVRIKFLSEMAN